MKRLLSLLILASSYCFADTNTDGNIYLNLCKFNNSDINNAHMGFSFFDQKEFFLPGEGLDRPIWAFSNFSCYKTISFSKSQIEKYCWNDDSICKFPISAGQSFKNDDGTISYKMKFVGYLYLDILKMQLSNISSDTPYHPFGSNNILTVAWDARNNPNVINIIMPVSLPSN